MVGAPGFEPGASCSQSRRATRLRHAPTLSELPGEGVLRFPRPLDYPTVGILPPAQLRHPGSEFDVRLRDCGERVGCGITFGLYLQVYDAAEDHSEVAAVAR